MRSPWYGFAEKHEWECRGCGCFNHVNDLRCWNCKTSVDGTAPPAPEAGDDDTADERTNAA